MAKWAAWLVVGIILTLLLYLPVWFVIGFYMYDEPHPDYWVWCTPEHIFPVAGTIAACLLLLAKRVFYRK